LEAVEAIEKYRPQVAVASWLTQKYVRGDTQGFSDGTDEEKIVIFVDTYIHIGNAGSHATKRILRYPHMEYKFDWLITRSLPPEDNVIYVW
jgi:hypothetical protein